MHVTPEEKLAVVLYEIAHLAEGDHDPSALVKYNGEVLLAVQRLRADAVTFGPWVELARKQMQLIGLKGGAVRTRTNKRPRGAPPPPVDHEPEEEVDES